MSDSFDLHASELAARDFDGFYTATPPWEIGRPQPVFVAALNAGLVRERVLDVGCGTGEHALLAAENGLDATGIDFAPRAIEKAVAKAAQRNLDVRFLVGDALQLPQLVDGTFDTVVDSALFHVFADEDRVRYVRSLAAVTAPGSRYLMLGFSDQVPGTAGPRRLSEREIQDAFADGWAVESIEPATLVTVEVDVPALFATVLRS